MTRILALILLCLTTAAQAEDPCGPEAACAIEAGDYHLVFPEAWDGVSPLPALLFFHGHNATAKMIFRKGGLHADFLKQGYLLIAPNGELIQGRKTRRWPGRDGGARDDVAYTLEVIEDVSRQVPLDRSRLYVAGFSAGGSMAWLVACRAAEHFAGFVSVSGALRKPNRTEDCPSGPVRMLQIHGFADGQVPFEGRGIRDWHQGDVFESLGLARRANGCRTNPDRIDIGDAFWCREWSDSCEAGAVKMCIHDGGHGLPRGWTGLARAFLEGTSDAGE